MLLPLQAPDLTVLHKTSPYNLHLYPNLELQQTFHRKPGVTQVKKAGSLLQNTTFPSYPPNPIHQFHGQLWSRLLATMSPSSLLSFHKRSCQPTSDFFQTHLATPDSISSSYSLGTFKLSWLEKQSGQYSRWGSSRPLHILHSSTPNPQVSNTTL